jgi:Mn2+/Fe2+ NRAMP family transporter
MALTAASLPFTVFPFMILMNDRHYVRDYGNGWIGNIVVGTITVLACILAIVTLPLVIFGA